ncbi:MAG: phosphoserine transaminase [Beijerinckiaceae bacterium]|nr:phosphoserine transaminase [Beijerinckiaceae bacterium]
MVYARPGARPVNPRFSSGPCAKRPGWSFQALEGALLGRSHRSAAGKAKLKQAIDLTREILEVPADYRIAIVPASDTGAVEMAMWSLLGARGVEVLAWEAFGKEWVVDTLEQLKLPGARTVVAKYGELPDLTSINFDNDLVFTWNGTAAGVKVPNGDFIPANRAGLTICDATSAAFAQPLAWDKLDVVTFSWQKVMGGEAAHGMLILGPRAVERLETFRPDRPLPKIFRLTENGKLIESLFEGETINTPSMLCVEDYIDTLRWAKSIGGLPALYARVNANAKVLDSWVARTPWIDFLAKDDTTRSTTGVCMSIVDPQIASTSLQSQAAFVKSLITLLENEGVAFDFGAYRDAPPGLRVWCGATVEASDIEALTHWLDWAFHAVKGAFAEAA